MLVATTGEVSQLTMATRAPRRRGRPRLLVLPPDLPPTATSAPGARRRPPQQLASGDRRAEGARESTDSEQPR
jgi:hypothetical protein